MSLRPKARLLLNAFNSVRWYQPRKNGISTLLDIPKYSKDPKTFSVIAFGTGVFLLYKNRHYLVERKWLPKPRVLLCHEQVKSDENPHPHMPHAVVQGRANDCDDCDEQEKQKKIGFKARKFIEYENRIRAYSTPDKIFRYFATFKIISENGESEIFMTPEDFLRSITPGEKQPDNLGLDQFKVRKVVSGEDTIPHIHQSENIIQQLPEDSIFRRLGKCGLLSFSDYIFLLTVLSTPQRNFEIAFRMFDLNGDGEVDPVEFEQVTNTTRSQSAVGKRHRDHKTTGNVVKSFNDSNSAIMSFFFGVDRDKKLTVQKFVEFQKKLQEDILFLEFKKLNPDENGRVTESKFARMMLRYSGFNPKRRKSAIKKVKQAFSDDDSDAVGLTFKEIYAFFQFLKHIHDVDVAFDFYNAVGADIDKATIRQVAKTVAGQDLSDGVLNVVFTVFDDDGNGTLSDREFISVMKRRLMRGLERQKDTGLMRLMSAAWKCAKETSWKLSSGDDNIEY